MQPPETPDKPTEPLPTTPEQATPPAEPVPQPVVPITPSQPVQPPQVPPTAYRDEHWGQIRSLLIKVMLGCVIAAAAVAVIAILVGTMNEVAWRAIGTLISAMVHIAILFGVISMSAPTTPELARSSNFAINSSMVIAILSFFTSVFGIWDVLPGDIAGKLYATYLISLVAILHAKTLMDIEILDNKNKPLVYANYAFILLVAGMLLVLIYGQNAGQLLGGFFGRALAASAIIDVTLSVVLAVRARLYMQKFPELRERYAPKGSGSPVARVIVALLLLIFVILPIISGVMRMMFYVGS